MINKIVHYHRNQNKFILFCLYKLVLLTSLINNTFTMFKKYFKQYQLINNNNNDKRISNINIIHILPEEVIMNNIIEFIPTTMWFVMRRLNKPVLKLIDPFITKLVERDNTVPNEANDMFMRYSGWKLRGTNNIIPFTYLQGLAFHAIKHDESHTFSIAKRISLAFSYDSSNIIQVLGILHDFINPCIGYNQEAWVKMLNIKRLIRNENYPFNAVYNYETSETEQGRLIRTFACLGVTYAEFIKIPLLLRYCLIFNDKIFFLDTKEIQFFTDINNEVIFISPDFFEEFSKILKIIPNATILDNTIINNILIPLIEIKISNIVELYKLGKYRINYLYGWIENYFKLNGITSAIISATQNTIDSAVYLTVQTEFNLVIKILMSNIITAEDIIKSSKEGYNLYMLTKKINDHQHKDQNILNNSSQYLWSPVLKFTNNVIKRINMISNIDANDIDIDSENQHQSVSTTSTPLIPENVKQYGWRFII